MSNGWSPTDCQQDGLATLPLGLSTVEEGRGDRDRGAPLRCSPADRPRHRCRGRAIRQPAAAGLLAASTGAGAALRAAGARPGIVGAIVSRGGRLDLGRALRTVKAPTMLIAGGRDAGVLGVNGRARDQLGCESYLEIIPAPRICSKNQESSRRPRLAGCMVQALFVLARSFRMIDSRKIGH